MRKTAIALLVLGLVAWTSAFAANAVRISQVYAAGGLSAAAVYDHDYIELFNSSTSPVAIGGWTIQYATAHGAFNNREPIPAGKTISACGYFLIRCANAYVDSLGGAELPTPDLGFSAGFMDPRNGKVALLSDGTINWSCPAIPPSIVDLVSYTSGASVSCFEGAGPAPYADDAGQTVTARAQGGMSDTDNNLADFSVLSTWTVHNSASAPNPGCSVVPVVPEPWGRVKTIYR